MKNAQVIYTIGKPDTHFDNLYVSRAHTQDCERPVEYRIVINSCIFSSISTSHLLRQGECIVHDGRPEAHDSVKQIDVISRHLPSACPDSMACNTSSTLEPGHSA